MMVKKWISILAFVPFVVYGGTDFEEKLEQIRGNTCDSLEFWLSNIRAAEAKAIAEALKTNKSLQELNLGLNKIGDDGGQALAKALTTNTSLKKLYLNYNPRISDEILQQIDASLKRNKQYVIQEENIKEPEQASFERQGLM